MPHKAETNPPPPSISQQDICSSGSAQLFPGGWNRWSGLVTLFSHCSRNLHHQAKLIIALDFAHQEKKDKLLSILCILTIFVTSQKEHFTLADAVLGGGCAMGLLCMGWKMPQVPKGGTNLVIAELTCTVTQTQSCDLSLPLLHHSLGETETSWALCWPEMLLFYTRHMGGTEKKNNSRILGVCSRFFWTGDIPECVIYVKNFPRKRGSGLPACCTLQST